MVWTKNTMYSIHQLRCHCCQPGPWCIQNATTFWISIRFTLNTKFLTYFHGDQNRKEIHGIIQVAKFSSHVCKRKKSHTMIIPMNFFLSFWPMHICIIFSFLLLTQINWLISKRCCLRLSIVWLFRFFQSFFLHQLWVVFWIYNFLSLLRTH